MVAIAQVAKVDFPLRNPGELISGIVTLKNVGDEPTGLEAGFFGLLITTLWDGQEYPLSMYSITAPGETVTFYFTSLGAMPEGEAMIEIVGGTRIGEAWRSDDVVVWSISEGGQVPEAKPVLPLLLIAAVTLLILGRK